MKTRITPLRRGGPLKRKTRLRPVSGRRESEVRAYAIARRQYLAAHPICEVWCREHNFAWAGDAIYQYRAAGVIPRDYITANELHQIGAPHATEVHHMDKRRGARLLDESQWLAVCRANHERIESNKAWARASGWLRDF